MVRNDLFEVLRYCEYSTLPIGIQYVLQLACSGKWLLVNSLQWYKISPEGAASFGLFGCF